MPTHTFDSAPDDLDVLLIPGGMGSRGEGSDEHMGPLVEYLKKLDLSGQGRLKWVLTVCTGSEILARTGALDGRRATSNKRAFNNVRYLPPPFPFIPLPFSLSLRFRLWIARVDG